MPSGLRSCLRAAAAVYLCLTVTPARADDETKAELQEMRAEIQLLRKQVGILTARVAQADRAAARRKPSAAVASAAASAAPQNRTGQLVPSNAVPASAQPPSAATQETTVLPSQANAGPPKFAQGAGGHGFFEHKAGDTVTFYVPHGEITAYGNLDMDIEGATKGIQHLRTPDGSPPIGHLGWQPAISTNLSYVGLRGFETIGGMPFRFVYQLETQIDISASSGIAESNSNQSNVVKGGLTSRNSYIGVDNPQYGALLIGKTDAPYKQSTARLNPFIGMVGDYAAIMGNTGGDNRVEFGTRLDHSIWYESPQFYGFKANVLYSPGQNRASNSDNIAAGESDCTGGNIPGSGGSLPFACNDGAFSDAVSASLSYTHGPLYIVAAYERHRRVNRSSDLTGNYASPPPLYFNTDVADEDAAKIGVQYTFPTQTTLGGIFEDLHRYVPGYLEFQNERQRTGYWLEATQHIDQVGDLSAGWAHADRTPGDPGQHNDSLELPPLGQPGDSVGGPHVNNTANLFTVGLIHPLGTGLSVYSDWALLLNGPSAHYALGAGGRAITYDCHDASDATGDETSNPHCWTGGHPQAVSLGLRYKF
jgi:predicted porin